MWAGGRIGQVHARECVQWGGVRNNCQMMVEGKSDGRIQSVGVVESRVRV
jgi:hypothetical protein